MRPEDVLELGAPTEGFLCPIEANVWGIEFLDFSIRDMDTNRVVFSVSRGDAGPPGADGRAHGAEPNPDDFRTIDYTFPAAFLDFRTVGTTLKFRVGDRPVRKFRMIERHYFRGRLLRSYDFEFPFCIPQAENEWEAVYDLPRLSAEERAEMVANPWECRSDSFYFVDGELVMHNKARYRYLDGEEGA